MKMILVRELKKETNKYIDKKVKIAGWVRNNRAQKEFGFLSINDGTTLSTIQVVYDQELTNFKEIGKINVGASVLIEGVVIATPTRKQAFEIKASKVTLFADVDEDYPIQTKRHSREFLRENAHLRMRTNLFNAVFRVRSVAAHAIHKFFQDQGFVYVHTPLITAVMVKVPERCFTVTTLPLEKVPIENGKVNYKEDFCQTNSFNRDRSTSHEASSSLETFILSVPTLELKIANSTSCFRVLDDRTRDGFCDLKGMMKVAEEMVKYIIKDVLDNCPEEMELFNSFVEKGLKDRLSKVMESQFKIITHEEAISNLLNSGVKFETKPQYHGDLAREHEKIFNR